MQTEFSQQLMKKFEIDRVGVDTFLLIKNHRSYLFSTAALEITKDLKGLWYLFDALRIIPAPIRDFFYKIFARNRYRLFGRSEFCKTPEEGIKSKFIGID